ncbi:alpha-hydroxy acid oxidase [Enterovirga rhinocerotis]|uniref:L-lactate dehydrogenase (Cytochrome) n=1 Tax=Enterovirga rhinocerotis TaxID=1339210 RepID=A0A4R7BV49_9HYPH|nr:alpha-hydroxy acid oxidase [Enterovirga rhinocerotis]TDR88932.1 L-lactate dehydrogenase (cytochrome) [Enterovirga rhinocerotis]
MPRSVCVADLRDACRRRIPRLFFEFVDHGSYDEVTIRANRADLLAIGLNQRVMVDVAQRSHATTIVGQASSMPLAVAPTGLSGFIHPNGEIEAALAAEDEGIPFCLSTMSICSLEEVRAATTKPFWFQLYVQRDRGFTAALVERAKAAECSALVVTVDLQVQGQRHRDIRAGLAIPPRFSPATILDMAMKLPWSLGILKARRFRLGNIQGHLKGLDDMQSYAAWLADSFDPSLSWTDLEWLRGLWPGKLIVKGILDPADARSAVAAGADAIVVSNHGGRQLDGARSTISALSAIADSVGGETEILFDSGVQTGQDVLKALALGAGSCMIGKAFLYGLGAGGRQGVRDAIGFIRKEMDVTMMLTGTRDVAEIGPSILAARP